MSRSFADIPRPATWTPGKLGGLATVKLEPTEVVYAFVTLADDPSESDESMLDAGERDRAARFVRAADRRRFEHAHTALRCLLARCLGVPPAAIQYRVGPNGKPHIADGLPHIEFNMAHSSELALIAVSRDLSVGVDVERLRNIPEANEIVASYFTEAERSAIGLLPPDQQSPAFLLHWTRKEAVIKATGEGLSRSLEGVDIELPIGAAEPIARVVKLPGKFDVMVLDLPAPVGFAAAGAVVRRSSSQARWRPLQPAR